MRKRPPTPTAPPPPISQNSAAATATGLVKLELLSRYYSDVLTIAHDYIITADYKLLPATEAIGEDYESGYIAYPPDVMEKLLALDGY